jgi:hypothetical protein
MPAPASSRSFAYNPGQPILGTEQVGNLAISLDPLDYTTSPGGVQWWQGPDQNLGYVIAHTVPGNNQHTPASEYLYLDPSHKGLDIELDGINQLAHQLFGYQQSVLGANSIKPTDKVMFSVLVDLSNPAALPESHFIGVGYRNMNYQGDAYSVGGFPGNDNLSVGVNAIGQHWANGTNYITGLPTWTTGDIVDVCIDNTVNAMWVRVNGGSWNSDPTADPSSNPVSGIEIIGAPFYPVLCPAFEGKLTIQNKSAYKVPNNFKFLGDETASVGFNRSASRTESSFIEVANSVSGQNFASGNDAGDWLTANGYWHNWSSFGSSGFQWMTINSVTSTTAYGIGQNSITVEITQSGGGMGITNGVFNPTAFPEQYGVPFSGNQILNQNAGTFTATFSQRITDALVAFASIGNDSLYVPIDVSVPFTPIFGSSVSYQNPVNGTQYTQLTGNEGYAIIRIDGTVDSVTFVYTEPEFYCNICFGFVDQNVL